jgi:hypothetical protein
MDRPRAGGHAADRWPAVRGRPRGPLRRHPPHRLCSPKGRSIHDLPAAHTRISAALEPPFHPLAGLIEIGVGGLRRAEQGCASRQPGEGKLEPDHRYSFPHRAAFLPASVERRRPAKVQA